MKKIEKNSVDVNLEGIRLFRDDLEEIMQSMNGFSTDIVISDDYNRYDSFDELLQHRGVRPLTLRLSCSKSDTYQSISLSIKKNTVSLHSYGGAEAHAMIYELQDYIKNKIPKLYRFINPFVWYFIFLLVFFLSIIISPKLSSLLSIKNPINAVLIGFLVVFLGSIAYRRLSLGVFLTKRHSGNVIKRNKDKIILLIIGGVVGVVGTLLIQWIASSK
jgi:hypothetical protein